MNNYEIIIEEFYNQHEANKGVNETIQEFTKNKKEILDITSHVVDRGVDNQTYVFIYRVSR